MPNAPIAEEMTDNQALRYQVSELRAQNNLLLGRYSSVTGSRNNAVSYSVPFVRAAAPTALKTVVTNQGSSVVCIFENGVLLVILGAKATWVSPLSGSGIITCKCNPSQYSTVAIATYLQ